MDACSSDPEAVRLAALHEHLILDTPPQQEFDDLVSLAAYICGVPIAAVSLVDRDRQWFKAQIGLDVWETPRDQSFCSHAIRRPGLMVVPDAAADARFADNPLVTGAPHIRFYAGVPLMTEEGQALGSLCVIDKTPRCLSSEQEAALGLLARQVSSQLAAVRRVAERERLVLKQETLVVEKQNLAARYENAQAERLRLAAIVESCADAVYSLTPERSISSWNSGAERLYGWSCAEVLGKPIDILIPPDRRPEMDRLATAAFRRDGFAAQETIRLSKTGERLDVSLRLSPVLDAAQAVIGISIIAHDIRDRKEAEAAVARAHQALAESEERLSRLTDAAFEGIVISQDDVLVDVSPAFATLFGYASPAEMLGLGKDALTAPTTREVVARRTAAHDEAPYDEAPYEAVLVRRDGTTFEAELRGRSIHWKGRPARITAIRDVTPQKVLENELRASRAASEESAGWLAEAQRLSQTGSWQYDLVTGRITWSQELFRLFGMNPDDGEPDYTKAVSLYHPEDAPKLDALVARAAQEGIGYAFDLRGAPPSSDAPPTWYHTVGSAVQDSSGRVVRLFGTLTNITQRKRMEEIINDHAVVLEFQKRELEEANAKLEALATTDGMTGLKNHRAFQEKLAEEVTRAARYSTPLSVILLDVDHFKQYNDTHGHPAGDTVLIAVARILQGCARATDTIARYGGEEFVLILPHVDRTGAAVFAERVRAAVENWGWPRQPVTASFGTATLRLGETSGAALISSADKALYRAKQEGRNRVVCDGAVAQAQCCGGAFSAEAVRA